MEAKERGAKVIHVDPRFTRTSAMADTHVPIRAGTDIAFLGAIIRHILENGREFREYVRHYTNARALISARTSATPRTSTACFSGWQPEEARYDSDSWAYARATVRTTAQRRRHRAHQAHGAHGMTLGPGRAAARATGTSSTRAASSS